MQDNAMVLYLQNGQWMVHYQGPHKVQIEQAFHTVDLPLPFTSQAKPNDVYQAVKNKNPNIKIGIQAKAIGDLTIAECLRQGFGDILWMK